ncbi:MAG: sugar ABC transporter ATP-binding protein [Candidatus Promineifilaceae bacterium]|nr:sugar ABC transporter ATP-binding protein [Candidatus Promineifilaceae bacterium]
MTGSEQETGQPILKVQNIIKRFPGVLALDNVSVEFYPGEVHAVVGENGAGKSTLMKVMAGAYRADDGQIFFAGERAAFDHPQEAQQAGISIIYQEFNLLPERTVAENIFLGREPSRAGVVDQKRMERDTVEVLKQLEAEDIIKPSALLGTLSVAEQQIVEIAKAISYDARVLIMDEPTAALASHEVAILTDLILRLKARGMAIIFISHRLIEVFELSQRITVLKDGVKVGTEMTANMTMNKVVEMMVGRELSEYFPERARPEDIGEVALSIRQAGNNFLHDISLEIRKGEIVGVAGLQGSGRTELARAIFGVDPFTSGEIEVQGKSELFQKPSQAIRKNFGFVTEDRKNEGLVLMQPINDNVLLTIRTLQRWLARAFPLGTRSDRDLAIDVSEHMDVRTPSMDQEVQYLSGGNQQKVVLSKWLATDAKVLIFDEPTRGIDVEAKAAIHERIRELARAGTAVLMISSELPEVIGMSDRIIVMWDGTITGELPAGATEAEIMHMATGFAKDSDEPQEAEAQAQLQSK